MPYHSVEINLKECLENAGVSDDTIEAVDDESSDVLEHFTVEIDEDDIDVQCERCQQFDDDCSEYENCMQSGWTQLSVSGFPLAEVLHGLFKDASGYSYDRLNDLLENQKGG